VATKCFLVVPLTVQDQYHLVVTRWSLVVYVETTWWPSCVLKVKTKEKPSGHQMVFRNSELKQPSGHQVVPCSVMLKQPIGHRVAK